MISTANLTIQFGPKPLFENVSVKFGEGNRYGLIGANGSGKSTFARTLNGLVRPSSGSVSVAGIDVAREPRRARDAVGFLFTNPDAQLLMPTPAEDIALSLRAAGVPKRDASRHVAEALARFGLEDRADQPSYSLSGGQKQLLALAAVLVRRPRVLVADEPTTLLDLGNARRIGRLLVDELEAQTVIVTHDLELAERCDVALRFHGGRLTEVGEPHEVVARYRREFA